MSSSDLLPDTVWAQLNPADGRLDETSRRRLLLGAAALVALIVLAILARVSGIVGSPLSVTFKTGHYRAGSRQFSETLQLHNGAWIAQRVDAINVNATYAALETSRGIGTSVPGHGSSQISVTIHITNCNHVTPTTQVPIVVEMHRWWGHEAETLTGQFDWPPIAWQACAPHHP